MLPVMAQDNVRMLYVVVEDGIIVAIEPGPVFDVKALANVTCVLAEEDRI